MTPEERARKPLTLEDAEAIEQFCPAVRAVTVSLYPRFVEEGPSRGPVTARYLSKEVSGIDYNGTLPATEEVFNSRPRIGRFFSDAENAHRADVAVIGSDIAKTLYPDIEPLGKPIMIDGVTYEVIGVLEPRKGGFVKDQSADRAVMVPYRSYHKHIPQDDEHFVGATAYPGRMSEAERTKFAGCCAGGVRPSHIQARATRTLTIVVTVAIGLGLVAVLFTVLNGCCSGPTPYRNHGDLRR